MKVSPKIVAAIAAALIIFGSAATWWSFKTKAEARRLIEEAQAYRSRAEQGDSNAERTLGSLYYHGQGVPQNYSQALLWYQKAADQGDPKAEYDLAYMYEFGLGSRLDYAEALKWYHQAADQDDPSANVGLGSMYYYGRGVSQDKAEAAKWYTRAADQGLSHAQYTLGYMYEHGDGLAQSRSEADRLYRTAADQGDKQAQRALGLRAKPLSHQGKIGFAVMFLGCLWLIKGPPRADLTSRQRKALRYSGLFGLVSVGLSIFLDFALLPSAAIGEALYSVKGLIMGVAVAMFLTAVSLKTPRLLLGISLLCLIALSGWAIARLDSVAKVVQAFCSIEGLLLGVAIASVSVLWLRARKATESEPTAAA